MVLVGLADAHTLKHQNHTFILINDLNYMGYLSCVFQLCSSLLGLDGSTQYLTCGTVKASRIVALSSERILKVCFGFVLNERRPINFNHDWRAMLLMLSK